MKAQIPSKPIDSELVGEVWPAAHPGADRMLYGHVRIDPTGAFEARSLQTFHLTYSVGRYGIDDSGGIRVVFRFFGDQGQLQTTNSAAPNYVTARTSTNARIQLSYDGHGGQRPWFKALTARLHGGYLKEGDQIIITFGDTSGGSPGMQMQTFYESAFEFKVLADVCAVGHFIPLAETPAVAVVAGAPERWKALIPTLRRPGEPFHLGIKAEDKWGNPSHLADGTLTFETAGTVKGLPDRLEFPRGHRAVTIENLVAESEGEVEIRVLRNGVHVATAGPLLVKSGRYSGYWGDLHGQSGESIGIGAAREYFDFARNKSFLDVTSHQANDFQVNNNFWRYLNELTREFHEDHRFVVFPGYEWSGNTAVGGDRNVFFHREGEQIHRSSHALIPDRSDLDTDAPDARELFRKLEGRDCWVYAHVGGRYADIGYAHDGRLETAMEIHSAWGTFEWLLTDGFQHGHRCGVVCNSDGHKGRPGASYPGAANFGAYGGLTCFYAEELTRAGIIEAIERRHHYGTTGCRMGLDVRLSLPGPGLLHLRDPKLFPGAQTERTPDAMMGDIIDVRDHRRAKLRVSVTSPSPIERLEIRNGVRTIFVHKPFTQSELGRRYSITWSGAEYRGRGRTTAWKGRATVQDGAVLKCTKINAWNLEHTIEQVGGSQVAWDTVTTGNFGGVIIEVDNTDASLEINTNHGDLGCRLADVGLADIVHEAGGLGRRLRISRLPDRNGGYRIEQEFDIDLKGDGDNPLWVCVTTEDGFQAWSSPIFAVCA